MEVSKTAFPTKYEQFGYIFTPLGLAGAPECFQVLLNDTFGPYLNSFLLVYLNDGLIYSKARRERVKHLMIVLQKLRENELCGKILKCEYLKSRIQYQKPVTKETESQVDEREITLIRDWELTQSLTQVQSFLGLCDYYRRIITNVRTISRPLTDLTKKESISLDKTGKEILRAAKKHTFLFTRSAVCTFLCAMQAIGWYFRSRC